MEECTATIETTGEAALSEQFLKEIEQIHNNVKMSEEILDNAEKNYRLAQDQYRSGKAGKTDVIDARMGLERAKEFFRQSLVDLKLVLEQF